MKRSRVHALGQRIAVLALASGVAAGVARADEQPPPKTIAAPKGWTIDEEQSKTLGAKLRGVPQFGLAAQPYVNVDAYVPAKPGVVLTVSLIAVECTAQCDAAARTAVDELRGTSTRAALAGSGIVEDGSQEKVDSAAKQVEATLAWRDTAAKTNSQARLLVASDGKNLLALTGECFAADDADKQLVADCKAALATLDVGLPDRLRVALALAPPGTRPAPPTGSAGTAGTAGPAGPMGTGGSGAGTARMGGGSRAPLPPITVPLQQARAVDRRPVYVGLGLVVLAAVFWWNRRRRARHEEKRQ